MFNASVITISDEGFTGEKKDTSGENIINKFNKFDFEIISYTIIPNNEEIIKRNIIKCCDMYRVNLLIILGLNDRVINDDIIKNVKLCTEEEQLKNKDILGIRDSTLVISLSNSSGEYEPMIEKIINILNEINKYREIQ